MDKAWEASWRARERAAWWLIDRSQDMFNRPRGAWVACEMQMVAHGLLGNGWDGILMQYRPGWWK